MEPDVVIAPEKPDQTDVEALTKQNGVRLLGKLKKKFKKKDKTDLPYLSFYKKKPETHIFFLT
jgi:hypothetical protein